MEPDSGAAVSGHEADASVAPKERAASAMSAEELPQLWASERAQLFDEVEVRWQLAWPGRGACRAAKSLFTAVKYSSSEPGRLPPVQYAAGATPRHSLAQGAARCREGRGRCVS